ncbi:MAG: hypothetical protein K6G88_06885 [Lachnospiraceae bacterium]|nr:hypothetical protein [Lachnospiraceae bacterium]
MYENITNDFLKKGFRPIYSKKSEQPFAYGVYGEKEIHLYNDNYTYELCNYCGTINAEEKQSTDKFCDFYVLENIPFEDSPVVASREYYYGNQVMLVSPELYSYITERIKNAKFIPVFLKKEE